MSRSLDNVLEYLASFNTSGPLTSNSLLSDPNDKNGLINVTSDKIKAQFLSTTTLKVSFLAVKHNTCNNNISIPHIFKT